jgi:AcrR family transcriptional regulator
LVGVSEAETKTTRPYQMRARAKAAAATGQRILDAAEAVFDERPTDEFTLAEVAERAGVTVQTIIRRFGSRKGLIAATLIHVGVKMGKDRSSPTADPRTDVEDLVDHYEQFGDRILRLLAEEDRNPALLAMTNFGRSLHRRWCEQAFEAALGGLRGVERERRVAQFVAITDIYMWKLLRRDRRLSTRQTKLALREMLEPLIERRP